MWSSFIFIFYTHLSMPMFWYMSHTHAYYFSWGFWRCDFLNFICIIYVLFLFTFFCHLSAHQHLTWPHCLLPWLFQNSLSYCWLRIFMSISFFIIKSALSTTLLSLSFSTSSCVPHSKQFDSHTSQMWLSTSFLFLRILPQ